MAENAFTGKGVEWRPFGNVELGAFCLFVDGRAAGWSVHREGVQWACEWEAAPPMSRERRWLWFTERAAKDWALARWKESRK